MESHVASISHAIQLAVAPVFLLTAIATFINVMHTRLGRIVDRRRVLQDRVWRDDAAVHPDGDDEAERDMLDRRASLIYAAIFAEVLSALLVCLVVASAFLGALYAVDAARVVAALFVLAMLATLVGLSIFLREIYLGVMRGGHRRR